jgi:hypothetical protein
MPVLIRLEILSLLITLFTEVLRNRILKFILLRLFSCLPTYVAAAKTAPSLQADPAPSTAALRDKRNYRTVTVFRNEFDYKLNRTGR